MAEIELSSLSFLESFIDSDKKNDILLNIFKKLRQHFELNSKETKVHSLLNK